MYYIIITFICTYIWPLHLYGRVMTITLLCIYTCTLYMYQYSSRNKREKKCRCTTTFLWRIRSEVGICSNYNNYTTFMPPISYIMRWAFHLVNYLSKKMINIKNLKIFMVAIPDMHTRSVLEFLSCGCWDRLEHAQRPVE